MTKENDTLEPNDASIRRDARKKQLRIIAFSVYAVLFLTGLMFGVFNPIHKKYSKAHATLVLISNILGLACLIIPPLLRRLFHVEISLTIALLWWTFVLCHSFGETLKFYYNFIGWDKVLHFSSGVLQFITFFGMARSFFANKNVEKKFLLSLIFAIAASLAVACLWELIEFAVDSMFGTNMQKVIPSKFFNGGDTFAELNGAAEEIAAFYRSPSGYRFALVDSMLDCVTCLTGTILGTILTALITRKKSDFLEGSFAVRPQPGKTAQKAVA